MTPSEVRTARQALGFTEVELADTLGVTSDEVRAWEAGTARVPRRAGRLLNYETALKRHFDAMDASGLPRCEWVRAWEAAPMPDGSREIVKHVDALNTHAAGCATCLARDRYAATHLPPLPERPMAPEMRVLAGFAERVEKLPRWLRPAVLGAALPMAIVSLRALFALPVLLRQPSQLPELAAALVAAGGAGAVGGLLFSVTRPALRRLGRPGDYLSGIVAVVGYLGALALAAPFAFGESAVGSPGEALALLVGAIFFGLVIGHTWFRD